MSEILLLNPRRKRRGKRRMPAGLARYWASHRRRATNPRRRRRHARRHVARVHHKRRRVRMMPVLTNRRRRRAHRRHHVRRYRASNPRRRRFGGGGSSVRGMVKGYVIPGVIGGVGTLALDVVYGYVSPYLPAQLQAGWFGVGAKLAVILATGYALNKFAPRLRPKTQVAVLGATTVLAYGAIKQAVAGMLPAGTTIPGLSGYGGGMGAYLPDFQRMPVRSLGAYMPRVGGGLADYYSPAAVIGAGPANAFNGLGRLGAYMPAGQSQPHTGGVAGFDYMNDGM